MNIEKSKKRISKKVKMGFQGYPELSIAFLGETTDVASRVVISFVADEDSEPMKECLQSTLDAREDEVILSAIVKMIERSGAKTVKQVSSVELI